MKNKNLGKISSYQKIVLYFAIPILLVSCSPIPSIQNFQTNIEFSNLQLPDSIPNPIEKINSLPNPIEKINNIIEYDDSIIFQKMDENINIEKHKKLFFSFPKEYREGIVKVRLYSYDFCSKYGEFGGTYQQPNGILFICDYSEEIYAHELSHWKDYKNRGNNIKNPHDNEWCKVYLEIINKINTQNRDNYNSYCGDY